MPLTGNGAKGVVGVIPARYRSSRFPGKPLAEIGGLPMIVHVYRAAAQCTVFDWISVATDDERIGQVCEEHGVPWAMTSSGHPTGTDRVAEVARQIEAAVYINIQGDEPMLKPDVIEAAARPLVEDTEQRILVTNLCASISDPAEVIDTNVIKVALAPDGHAVYLSRQPIPYPKSREGARYQKTGVRVRVPPRSLAALRCAGTRAIGERRRHRTLEVH